MGYKIRRWKAPSGPDAPAKTHRGGALETATKAIDTAEMVTKALSLVGGGAIPVLFNRFILGVGQGLFEAILVTTPLTLAVAILAYGLFSLMGLELRHVVMSIGSIVAGNLLGWAAGAPAIRDAWSVAWEHHAGLATPVYFGLLLAGGYVKAYGWQACVASIVVGALVGGLWGWFSGRRGV